VTERGAAATLALVIAMVPGIGRAAPPPATPPIRISRPDGGGLVSLPDGALLAWEIGGKIAARDAAGNWGPAVATGVERLAGAVPDPEGALVFGASPDPGGVLAAVVLLVGGDARERARWTLPNLPLSSVARVHGRRWAATARGLVELAPGGKIETRAPAESTALLLAGADGTPAVCVPRDVSMAHQAPPRCHSVEGEPWQANGAWSSSPPPFACGAFSFEQDGTTLRSRSLHDGRVGGQLRLARGAVVACGGPDEVIVADPAAVSGYAPGDLSRRWRQPTSAAGVTAAARAGDEIILFRGRGAPVTIKATGH
jgi:hypothetical protein